MMQIVKTTEALAEQHAADIAELVHATGPVSYDYHFPKRAIFDDLVGRSWQTNGTLFASEATHLAVDGDELLGIEIGFPGPELRPRQDALGPLWTAMVEGGTATRDDVAEVLERAGHASWLNPVVHPGVYYVHALSVKPAARGRRVGMQLLSRAIEAAREKGDKALQLDVLSDNPAVNFYQSMGLELLVESRAPKPEAHGVPPEWRMGILL